jgi:hypothetical protein
VWILKVSREGCEIPFNSLPWLYSEKSNRMAQDNMNVVKQILYWLIIERPLVVRPVGLVSKVHEGGSIIHKLVFDTFSHINILKFICKRKSQNKKNMLRRNTKNNFPLTL